MRINNLLMYVIIGAAKIQNPEELVNTRSICVVRVIFYHTLLFFYNFTIPFTFFFSLGVCIYQSSIKKREKNRCSSSGKGLVITCLSNAIPRPSTLFVLSRAINVGVDIYQPVSSESSNLTYTQRLLPPPAGILYNYVEYVQNLRTIG